MELRETVARALHAHEWAGQPKPDNFGTDRDYWLGAADAILALPEIKEGLEAHEALRRSVERQTIRNKGAGRFVIDD